MSENQVVYKYPEQFGVENTITVSCGAEGFTVTGHSNEILFSELEDRIMNIVKEVAGKIKEEPKIYHG